MELSFGTSGVAGFSQETSYAKGPAGQNPLALPKATTLTAKLGHDVLQPTSFFQQVKTLSHFVSRARLQPLATTRTDRDDSNKRRTHFIRTVRLNKSEATGNRTASR